LSRGFFVEGARPVNQAEDGRPEDFEQEAVDCGKVPGWKTGRAGRIFWEWKTFTNAPPLCAR
jgi:hypothetical protein